MPDNKTPHLEFWSAVKEVLADADRTLPWGDDPRKISWDHPDETWKNDAELRNYEIEFSSSIESMVSYYCEHRKWPKKSKSGARFILAIRLEWARNFAHVLSVPSTILDDAAIQRPTHGGWEVIRWLLTDAYENRFPPSPHNPMIFPQRRD